MDASLASVGSTNLFSQGAGIDESLAHTCLGGSAKAVDSHIRGLGMVPSNVTWIQEENDYQPFT
jgi:hypothetical protein